MFLGADLRAEVQKTVVTSSGKFKLELVRQRYSDCAIVSVDVFLTFSGLPTIELYAFLANKNQKEELTRLRTQNEDESGMVAIHKELGKGMEDIAKYITSCLEKSKNIRMVEILNIIQETCLK